MRCFVTGGSGFVGRELITALIARGDEVRALARSDSAEACVKQLGAKPIAGDLSDPVAMAAGMRGCKVVFHVAAKVDDWGRESEYERINVQGTQQVIDAAITAGVKRLVHISTEAVLADGSTLANVDETRPRPDPETTLPRYPRSKNRAEALVEQANGSALTTVIVRPRMIWGRGDTTILPQLADAVTKGLWTWIEHGRYKTSTCHVRNVVEGTLLAAEKGQGGAVYFLTDGAPISFHEHVTGMLATRGLTPQRKSMPRWVAWRLAQLCELAWSRINLPGLPPITRVVVNLIGQEVTVSDAKARRELGYQGRVTRQQGLQELSHAQ